MTVTEEGPRGATTCNRTKLKRLKEVNKEIEEFVDNHTSTGAVDPVTGNYVVTLDDKM